MRFKAHIFLTDGGVLKYVDRRQKDVQRRRSPNFTKTNVFASKRLNLFVVKIVAKLLRANGGCLGVKCRRKTWKAAISFGEGLNTH